VHKSGLVFGALLVLVLTAAMSQPAYAHAVFINGYAAYTVNTTQTLTMNVPNERDDTDYNVDIKVAIPAGWQALSCVPKATWSCTLTTEDGRRVVHFAKTSGNVLDENEVFKYTVHTASTVGSFAFPTVQTYETGEIVRWIGAPGSEEPAPVLGTLAANAPPPATTPATAPSHARPPTTASATPTTQPPTPVTSPHKSSLGVSVSPPSTQGNSSTALTTPPPAQVTTTTAASTTRTSAPRRPKFDESHPDASDGIVVGQATTNSTSGSSGGSSFVTAFVVLAAAAAGGGWLLVRRARKHAVTPPSE